MLHRLPPPKLLQVNHNAHTTTCCSERRTSTLHNYHYSVCEARGIGSAALRDVETMLCNRFIQRCVLLFSAPPRLRGEAFAFLICAFLPKSRRKSFDQATQRLGFSNVRILETHKYRRGILHIAKSADARG